MKNREKYKNELIEAIKEYGNLCEFMIKHGISQMFGKDTESFCIETECQSCTTALQIWLDEEYKEPPKPEVDWNKVPVDTLVRVWDDENDKWTLRYFKGLSRTPSAYPPGYDYEVFALGATSVTAEEDTERWRYCELVEDKEEDNGKI